jgi:hypothetical protein
LYNTEVSNGGLITFPGGSPLKLNGEVVGGNRHRRHLAYAP